MSKVLVSYAYFRRKDLYPLQSAAQGHLMLFGDSGAHSARTLGLHIDVPALLPWLRQWDHLFTVYANLDVIGAPEATWRNQQRLEAEGLRPLPVYHTGEPLTVLDRYIEAGHRYIALGKLLGNPRAQVMAWLTRVFNHAPGVVFHGFGMTVWEALRDFPFYSVDSSSWTGAFQFARLNLFEGGRWVQIPLRDKAVIRRYWQLIERHGGHPGSLIDYKASRDRVEVARMSAMAYRRAEVWLRRRHQVPLPESPVCPVRRHALTADPGPHMYLANANSSGFTTTIGAEVQAPEDGPHVYLVGENRTGATTEVAAQVSAPEPGPHVYLADTSPHVRDAAAVHVPAGPHLYLADTGGPSTMAAAAARSET